MPRFTFRFGELKNVSSGDRPQINLEQVRDKIEEEGIVGDQGNRIWCRKPILGPSSIYFEFLKEVPEQYPAFSDDDRIVSEEIARVRAMHCILFENGVYGFESKREVMDQDAFEYIFDKLDERYDLHRFDSLDLQTMRRFYKRSYEVRKFKAEHIGEREPNPRVTDQELREITEDTGLKTNSIVASVGRAKNNLKEVSLFQDGIAKFSDLPMIKTRDSEGKIQQLRDSGRLDFSISADDEDEQAIGIRNRVRNAMQNMFNVEVSEEEDDNE